MTEITTNSTCIPYSQEVESVEAKRHDSGLDTDLLVRQLREEIHELKQRLESAATDEKNCDNKTIDCPPDSKQEPDDKAEDLAAKCRDLEETLDLMRGEFENMEDYWQVGYHILSIFRILFCIIIVRLQNRKKR